MRLRIGRLIAETYRTYNLLHADPDEQDRLLGPFRHAFSDRREHQHAICGVVRAPMLYVAETGEDLDRIPRRHRLPGRTQGCLEDQV